jgi:hypothetical protein
MNSPDVAAAPRRRLWIWLLTPIAALTIFIALVLVGRNLLTGRVDKWYHGRVGDVVVLEKLAQGSPGADSWSLRVRLDVSAATDAEARLIPAGTPGREDLLGTRSFEMVVPVTREKWELVSPGARIRAVYLMDVGRSRAFISSLYLDALGPSESKP